MEAGACACVRERDKKLKRGEKHDNYNYYHLYIENLYIVVIL